jgi:hypothetical protein
MLQQVSAGLEGLLSEDFVPEYGFPLILADPPWPCKSRGIGYHSMSRKDLVALGALLRPLLHERALLGVWVTNDESIVRFVREELLPAWGAEPQGPTWFWVKVLNHFLFLSSVTTADSSVPLLIRRSVCFLNVSNTCRARAVASWPVLSPHHTKNLSSGFFSPVAWQIQNPTEAS